MTDDWEQIEPEPAWLEQEKETQLPEKLAVDEVPRHVDDAEAKENHEGDVTLLDVLAPAKLRPIPSGAMLPAAFVVLALALAVGSRIGAAPGPPPPTLKVSVAQLPPVVARPAPSMADQLAARARAVAKLTEMKFDWTPANLSSKISTTVADSQLQSTRSTLAATQAHLAKANKQLAASQAQLKEQAAQLHSVSSQLHTANSQLHALASRLRQAEGLMRLREEQLEQAHRETEKERARRLAAELFEPRRHFLHEREEQLRSCESARTKARAQAVKQARECRNKLRAAASHAAAHASTSSWWAEPAQRAEATVRSVVQEFAAKFDDGWV